MFNTIQCEMNRGILSDPIKRTADKKVPTINDSSNIQCPSCRSKAVYRYGRARNKQRFFCLICGRQFIAGHERHFPKVRPTCQKCGKKMFIYQNENLFVRYRCSGYPVCKNYVKILREDNVITEEAE